MATLNHTNSPSKIADRLKALQENQQKWKSKIQSEKRRTENAGSPGLLHTRKSALLESADDWRKRVRTEAHEQEDDARKRTSTPVGAAGTEMQAHSGRVLRSRRQHPTNSKDDKDSGMAGCDGTEAHSDEMPIRQPTRDSDDSISPKRRASVEAMRRDEPSETCATQATRTMATEESNKLSTPRRAAPRALNRRPPTRARATEKPDTDSEKKNGVSMDPCRSAPSASVQMSKFELGREFDVVSSPASAIRTPCTPQEQNKENRHSLFALSPHAFQTPIIGKEHCGVKLRTVERKSPFPGTMLIQARGVKQVDVRLVAPKRSSVRSAASYLLVTSKRLVVYNGEQSSVSERSKIAQMAHEILAGKEMGCLASKVEMANDEHAALSAFWRCLEDDIETSQLEICTTTNDDDAFYEDEAAQHLNHFYEVLGDGVVETLEKGTVPTFSLLDSSKILVLDFGSEVYTWTGRTADRCLLKTATDFAQKLRSSPLDVQASRALNSDDNGDHRPEWTLSRRLTQGIADCTFRHKFSDWKESSKAINLCTPSLSPLKRTPLRPMSAPAHNLMSPTRISTPGVEEFLKDEDELAKQLADKFANECAPQEHVLILESVELRHSDKNVYTEKTKFYRLVGEALEDLEQLEEFRDTDCYVIEWRYRIEREGVRKLDGSLSLHDTHDTGRQRVAYFYWLGSRTTVKEQSLCALALRNRDKERHEHVRVEQGAEPPVFLHLFSGRMIVSGAATGVYLVTGSEANLFSAQELYEPIELRPQAAYFRLSEGGHVQIFRGQHCAAAVVAGTKTLAEQLAKVRNVSVNKEEKPLTDLRYPCLSPTAWTTAPRAFRIYELEGDELQCVRYNAQTNFTFRQEDLRDCILMDQKSHLWIWADHVVSTYALQVANEYWSVHRHMNASEGATVVCRGREPDAFKALFPTWHTFDNATITAGTRSPSAAADEFEPDEPQPLATLLHERTRSRTIQEVRERNMPKGCSLNHLEQYLCDSDFEALFKMSKNAYKALPRWKQISLKKEAKIF